MSTQPLVLNSNPNVNEFDKFMGSGSGSSPSLLPQGTPPGPDAQTLAAQAPKFVPGALTGVGAAIGDVPGAIAGSALGKLLQSYAPSIFGEGPKDVTDALTGIGTDAATQGIASGLGMIASKGIVPALAKVPGINKLPGVTGAQAAEDAYHAALVSKTTALQDALTNESLAETAHKLNSAKPEPIPFADTEKPDVAMTLKEGDRRILPNKKVEVLKTVPVDQISGDPGNQINEGTVQMYQKNTYNKPAQLRDNPDGGYTINEGHHRILADVRNGKNNVLAWTPDQEVDTETALTKAQKGTQKAQEDFNSTVAGGPQLPKTEEPSILSSKGAGKYLLRAAAVGGIGHALGSYETGAGVVLTASQLAKLAKSPQLGAAILTAQRTPVSATSAALINKLILHSLVGESVDLPDGSSAKVGSDGVPR